ncbi:hypothetical protein Tco_0879974 [Tanacetum coccineum]
MRICLIRDVKRVSRGGIDIHETLNGCVDMILIYIDVKRDSRCDIDTHERRLIEYYYKKLTFNESDEEVTSKVKTHEKRKRDAGSVSSEELVAWMTFKDFLHFPGNRLAFFSARLIDVPMSVGSPAGSAANIPGDELEMVVAGPVANNAIGAKAVPPSTGRRWRDVDSKAKRVSFPNSAGSPSFKEKNHVVLDKGPSSPKSVPDFAPSDEAYNTLFGSLASTEDPRDSDPFLPGIKEAHSSCDALYNLSYPDALSAEVFRLRGEVESLKDKVDLANQERSSLVRDFFPHAVERLLSCDHLSFALVDIQEKVMLVGRSQTLREVASLGIGLELEDMKDFDPNVEENYDRAIESFYRVKFPYVDLLVHYASQSVGKLMTLNPPIIPFGNASAACLSVSPFL